MQKGVEVSMKNLIELFRQHGCSVEAIQDFIQSNFQYLIEENVDSSKNLYFVYNHKNLYGVIWVYGDEYEWSVYEDGKFRRVIKDDDKEHDYIIDMILEFTDAEKIKRIVPDIEKMNLENKIKILKKIKLNSQGYHLE